MAKTEQEKAVAKIERSTIKAMTELQVYRPEFRQTVKTYAQLRWQYNEMFAAFVSSGCEATEEYTNKAGVTNIRKTPEYQIIENLRRDILTYENTLGLTPAGLKKIKSSVSLSGKKSSIMAGLINP